MFFTNTGKVYRIKAYEIPEASRTARGTAIVNLLQLEPEEKITAMISMSDYKPGYYLFMATKNGIVKKTPVEEYRNVRKTGLGSYQSAGRRRTHRSEVLPTTSRMC